MVYFNSAALFALLVIGQFSFAATCFKGRVDTREVLGLKQPANLFFLAPMRSEPGVLTIRAPGLEAENIVSESAGQPVRYYFDGDAGSMTQGSIDGATTLNVENGALLVTPDHSITPQKNGPAYFNISVRRSRPARPITSHVYRLELIGETECRVVFGDRVP